MAAATNFISTRALGDFFPITTKIVTFNNRLKTPKCLFLHYIDINYRYVFLVSDKYLAKIFNIRYFNVSSIPQSLRIIHGAHEYFRLSLVKRNGCKSMIACEYVEGPYNRDYVLQWRGGGKYRNSRIKKHRKRYDILSNYIAKQTNCKFYTITFGKNEL